MVAYDSQFEHGTYIYVHTYTYIYVYIYVCIYIYIYVYIYMQTGRCGCDPGALSIHAYNRRSSLGDSVASASHRDAVFSRRGCAGRVRASERERE